VNWLSFLGQSGSHVLDQWVVDIASAGGISEDSARGVVEWHGKRALTIAPHGHSAARSCVRHYASTANTSWRKQWMLSPTNAQSPWQTFCCAACR